MDQFAKALLRLADAYDEAPDCPPPGPPEAPIVTTTRHADAVEIRMVDARVAAIEVRRDLLKHATDDEFAAQMRAAMQAALDDHQEALAATYVESGGQPNAASVVIQAQSYASTALMMALEDGVGHGG